MFQYAICEIAGKQYKVVPGKELTVANLGEVQEIKAKVLLLADGEKIEVGNPFLKDELKLKIVENSLGKKLSVFKYHAKANYRKNRGYRSKVTKVVYSA